MNFIPNTNADRRAMLDAIGVASMDDLFADVPADQRRAEIELLLTALAGTHLAHPGTHLPGTAGRGVGVAQAPRTGGDGQQ